MNGLLTQVINVDPPEQFRNLVGFNACNFIPTIIYFLLIVASLAFFFIVILGGIKWITSSGDKAKIESSRSQITAGLIGLVIVFSTWAILGVIENFFGVNLKTFNSVVCQQSAPPPGSFPGACMSNSSSGTCVCACPPGSQEYSNNCGSYPTCTGSCICLPIAPTQTPGLPTSTPRPPTSTPGPPTPSPLPTPTPTPAIPLSCILCATMIQQNIYSGGFGSQTMGQSFTELQSCGIDYVEVCLDSRQVWSIQIRQGEDINGSLLGTASVSDTGIGCTGWGPLTWFRGNFTGRVSVIASYIYTIRIDQSGSVYQAGGNSNNPYSGGRMYRASGWESQNDLMFRVHGCPWL